MLEEIEHMLLEAEPDVPSDVGNRIYKGLPRLWEGSYHDVINDYSRHAFLIKLIGDIDTTLGYAHGLTKDDLLRCADRCLLIYVIYKMCAIKVHKKGNGASKYFAIKMGRYGGFMTHRASKIEVAIDIFYTYGEEWMDFVHRNAKLNTIIWTKL